MDIKRIIKKQIKLMTFSPNSPNGFKYRAFLIYKKASKNEREILMKQQPEFVKSFLALAEDMGETLDE